MLFGEPTLMLHNPDIHEQTVVFEYGGDLRTSVVSIRFVHQMPPAVGSTVGPTITIDIWRARPTGESTFTFGMDLHTFPVTFTAIRVETDWSSTALAEGRQLYKLTLEEAPPY